MTRTLQKDTKLHVLIPTTCDLLEFPDLFSPLPAAIFPKVPWQLGLIRYGVLILEHLRVQPFLMRYEALILQLKRTPTFSVFLSVLKFDNLYACNFTRKVVHSFLFHLRNVCNLNRKQYSSIYYYYILNMAPVKLNILQFKKKKKIVEYYRKQNNYPFYIDLFLSSCVQTAALISNIVFKYLFIPI